MHRENDIVQTFVSLLNDSGVTFSVYEQDFKTYSVVVIEFRFGGDEYVIFYDDHVAFDDNTPTLHRMIVEYSDPMLAHYLQQCVDSDSFRLMLTLNQPKEIRVEHEPRK